MRKISLYIALLILVSFSSPGQSSLSFYNLGNATFQNTFLNPALIPEGKVFIGLPVLSGVHLNFNNKSNYSNVITRGETQNQIDLNSYLGSLQKNNMTHVSANVNLFHLAISTKPGQMFSVFANERMETDFLYDKSLMEFAINGNGAHLGETVKIGKTRLNSTYYREYGIGYAATVQKIGLTVGVRAKYLQGFVNASTAPGFQANLTTDAQTYALNLDLQNGTLRTSGLNAIQGNSGYSGSYLVSNNNKGAAFDLGITLKKNDRLTIAASLLDVGFISWNDDIKNHTEGDTSMVYSGINLKKPDQIEQTIKDSLINRFKDRKTESYDPYKTWLSPKMYLSGTYNVRKGGDVIGTFGTRYVMGQMKFLFGAGYRQQVGKFFVGSVNVTKLPQQFLNLGAALAIKGGPAQFYIAADQVVLYDMTKFKSFDFRVGLNFVFGKHDSESISAAARGTKSNSGKSKGGIDSFLGSKVQVKGKEGIYTIIKKQGRRRKKDFEQSGDPVPKENVNPKLKGVISVPPDKPSDNPNLKDVLSVPPIKPSENPNLKEVLSIPPPKQRRQPTFSAGKSSPPIPRKSNKTKVRKPKKEFKSSSKPSRKKKRKGL